MRAMSEILRVGRAEGAIEELWEAPAGVGPVDLRRATDGTPPRLGTSLVVWNDGQSLCALFSMVDDAIVATMHEHDAPLYQEDVVELFLAPRELTEYFEIEVSPLGTVFDARIESPDGVRTTMRTDVGWTCEGLFAAVKKVWRGEAITVETLVKVPFAALGAAPPEPGSTWRANFFRIDRGSGDEYSAWQPTLRQPADFHVAAAFGTLQFE